MCWIAIRAGSFPVGRYVTKSPTNVYTIEKEGVKTDLSDALVCGRRVYGGLWSCRWKYLFRDEASGEGGEIKIED